MNEDHDQIRALVAEMDLSRLTPAQSRTVEEHLAGCASCSELLADVREIRQHVRDGGEALFEPHPEPGALREFALGRGQSDPSINRHLRICAVCRLEVEVRRGRQEAGQGAEHLAPRPEGATEPWLRLGIAAAAAAVIGVAAGWGLRGWFVPGISDASRSGVSSPAQPVGSVRTSAASGSGEAPGSRSPGGSESSAGSVVGVAVAPILHLLPGLLRDGEPPRQRWVIDRSEPAIDIAVPIVVPASAADMDRFRFELRGAGTERRWSQEMTAARIREHLEAAEVVNLIVVPPQSLAEGDYEFRVVTAAGDAPPIYRAHITIAYRQSPAATKAPQ